MKFFFFSVLCLFVSSSILGQRIYKFDFGSGRVEKGYVQVLPEHTYNSKRGFGFEYSSGLISKNVIGKSPLLDDFITSDKPFYFSMKLGEGNYNVRVVLGDKKGTSLTTIKVESRRLMVENFETSKGKFGTAEFTVHLRDSIIRPSGKTVRLKGPRESARLHWDDKLTIEFNNKAAKLCAIEVTRAENIPTVFLAGNSTVVDQGHEPWASWGQMIPAFFTPGKLAIANYAESGETLKSFKGERRLEKIWSLAKKGDFLFIEFAHNDQKPGTGYLEPFTTYQQTVKEWIHEAKQRGMHVVLVTSTSRRSFDSSGRITNSLGDYPEAMRRTGKEEAVPVIDLNAMSKVLYETLGVEKSVKAFVHFPANTYPDQPKDVKDNTHFSVYGAYELAKCVVEGIRKDVPSLAKYLRKDLPSYDPSMPDDPDTWYWPPSSFISLTKPEGN
jgi:lysophospholipase L1-like esterase